MEYDAEEEISQKRVLGIFKKVGFIYPGKNGFCHKLGFCVKDQKIVISGKIEVSDHRNDRVKLYFTKKKPYKKIFGLDESPDIDVYEDSVLFGYSYVVLVPKNYITMVKPVKF